MALTVLAHLCIFGAVLLAMECYANDDAKRLYHDLLIQNKYNKLIRPVGNNTDRPLTVKMGIRLSQIIDVDELNQVMTTNVWIRQEWIDVSLRWDPKEYGGIKTLELPSENIWLPDIVLFNNADGQYEVTLMTKATLNYSGGVVWEPPAIYKSSCTIEVEFFPFDIQLCSMKFASWTYDGTQVDLIHECSKHKHKKEVIQNGIDLRGFYESGEWDVLEVTAEKSLNYTDAPDITFNVTIRRKTLFHTVNLIIPSVAISCLTILVFYLPSDSCEKITLCISILLSLNFFFLLLAEIIPPTSIVVPLIGKYLLFTMILITLSIIVTVITLNVHFRSPSTHTMAPWVRRVFLNILPKMLLMRRPNLEHEKIARTIVRTCNGIEMRDQYVNRHDLEFDTSRRLRQGPAEDGTTVEQQLPPDVQEAIDSIVFIAEHLKKGDYSASISEDWKYVAMVLDRLFLWIFTVACVVGTFGIILQAPTLYDNRNVITPVTSYPTFCIAVFMFLKKKIILKVIEYKLSADGHFEVQLFTKATLFYTGLIVWEPPAVYKSACIMNVEFFPFDVQKCGLKFGSWTYDGFEVDLVHVCAKDQDSTEVIENGMDFSEFYQNVEWDILSGTAKKSIKIYICCIEPYPDLTFFITMRRKTLFHTVNLILPCAVISFLTVLVFYLPSDSEEKITLCISVLLSLTVFFLLLTEIIPPTSIVIPLIGKYLLFTMILVTLSIIVTVLILTIHFRSPATHKMSNWTRTALLRILPKILFMRRPIMKKHKRSKCNGVSSKISPIRRSGVSFVRTGENHIYERASQSSDEEPGTGRRDSILPQSIEHVLSDVKFISDHLKEEDDYSSVIEDWKFAAMVLDRMFFWVFTTASLIGTFGILLQAPTIYDDREALSAENAKGGLC